MPKGTRRQRATTGQAASHPAKQIPQTAYIKYVYLDVVRYSFERTVEAQTDIIDTLNHLVKEAVAELSLPEESVVYIPTGDGICIAILNVIQPYDIHLRLACSILAELQRYNQQQPDEMRRFALRVGLNENDDNVIIDINGNRNVSGSGINIAARVMNAADGSMILVGESVYERLSHREAYYDKFRRLTLTAKHNLRLNVYQYIDSACPAVASGLPTHFDSSKPLPRLAAYYVGHLIKYRSFIQQQFADEDKPGRRALFLFLYYLALDAEQKSKASEFEPHKPMFTFADSGIEDVYSEFKYNLHVAYLQFVLRDFVSMFIRLHLWPGCTQQDFNEWRWCMFPSDGLYNRLRSEHPDIIAELRIDDSDERQQPSEIEQ